MPSPSRTLHSLLNRRAVSWMEERPSNQLVLPSCHIGVEMELEGTGASPLSRFERDTTLHSPLITSVQDGSLRNGIELVFSRPLFGENALAAIDHMYTVRDGLELNGSARTSTHVHVNFSDTTDTLDTLRSTIAAYLLVERAMSITAGPHREHNTFCVPTYVMNPGNERRYYDIVAAEGNDRRALDAIVNLGHENNRYAAMNLASLYRHGTVEFRQLGTVERNQLVMWINTLLSLKKCGLTYSVQQVLNGPDNLDEFVRTMLGEHASNCLVIDDDGRNYFTAARQRMRSMLDAAMAAEPPRPIVREHSNLTVREQLQHYRRWIDDVTATVNANGIRSAIDSFALSEVLPTEGAVFRSGDRDARLRTSWWNDVVPRGVRNLIINSGYQFPFNELYDLHLAYPQQLSIVELNSLRDRFESLASSIINASSAELMADSTRATIHRRSAIDGIGMFRSRLTEIIDAVLRIEERQRVASAAGLANRRPVTTNPIAHAEAIMQAYSASWDSLNQTTPITSDVPPATLSIRPPDAINVRTTTNTRTQNTDGDSI